MSVRIYGHRVKITQTLREYIESKLPRIEKYSDRIQNLEIVLEKEGPFHLAELRMKAGPYEVTAKHKDADPAKAVDLLIDKTERSLKKQHDIVMGKKKHVKEINRNAKKANHSPDAEPLPLIVPDGPVLIANGHDTSEKRDLPVHHEKLNIRIFRSPKAISDTMTIEEAAEELFFRDENFFCFNNAETNQVSILYRRKDGNFALMDTKAP